MDAAQALADSLQQGVDQQAGTHGRQQAGTHGRSRRAVMADQQNSRRDRDEWDDGAARLDMPEHDDFVQHGGHEPPDEVQDRPEQNVGYDEAVKGAPLTPEERQRSEEESPLSEEE
jgi:hypothetical protein